MIFFIISVMFNAEEAVPYHIQRLKQQTCSDFLLCFN